MFERWLVPALATVLSLVFFLAGLASVALILFRTAIPCRSEGGFYTLTQIGVVIALFTSAVLMEKLKLAPKVGKFVIAFALPALAIGLYAIAAHWNMTAQRICAEGRSGSTNPIQP